MARPRLDALDRKIIAELQSNSRLSVQELAEYLMKGDFYDYAGTDMHSLRHLELMQKLPAAPLNRLRDSGRIKNSGL